MNCKTYRPCSVTESETYTTLTNDGSLGYYLIHFVELADDIICELVLMSRGTHVKHGCNIRVKLLILFALVSKAIFHVPMCPSFFQSCFIMYVTIARLILRDTSPAYTREREPA